MSVVIVGSMALDTVETPFGKMESALGGAVTYSSVSCSYFTQPKVVAVVGKDFPNEHIDFLRNRNIDLEGLQIVDGKTFRWSGRYSKDLSERETLSTCLNVFEKFNPILPNSYRDVNYIFLANIDPELQYNVLTQVKNPKFVLCDTMNFWILHRRNSLLKILNRVDALVINDSETRDLTGEYNLIKGAKAILRMGPKIAIIKKGEHGAMVFMDDKPLLVIPAYPLENALDPTGAGDTFAGAFIGYLAKVNDISKTSLKKAMMYGTIVASFCVEGFGLNRMKNLTTEDIERRFNEFKNILVS